MSGIPFLDGLLGSTPLGAAGDLLSGSAGPSAASSENEVDSGVTVGGVNLGASPASLKAAQQQVLLFSIGSFVVGLLVGRLAGG